MTDVLTHALSFTTGLAAMWFYARPRLGQLRRLTDRDARGRFVRREP